MVLFDSIVDILALADSERPQCAPRPVPQSVLGIARNDRLTIGLTAVKDDAIGSAMAIKRLAQEAFRRR